MEGLSVPKMHSDCREAEGDGGSGGGCDENINDKVEDGTHYNGSKPKSVDDDADDDDVDDDDDDDDYDDDDAPGIVGGSLSSWQTNGSIVGML